MPISAYPLDVSLAVTLDSAGAGQVTLGPRNLLQTWNVKNVAVRVATNTLEPVASVYTGPPQPANFIAASQSGSLDSTDVDLTLRPGNVVVIRWTGGDAGARATGSLYGSVHLGRP